MVQRYNPDYVMHAARFEPFAREAEHGEFVRFSDYEALVSELASSRQINAQTLQVKLTMAETIKELTDRVNALDRQLSMSEAKCKGYFSDAAAALVKCDALAVENAAMRNAIDFATAEDMWIEQHDGMLDYRYQEWYVDVLNKAKETPATDAALAAIQAQGVEMFVAKIAKQLREAGGERGYNLVDWCGYADHLEDRGEKFAIELREAK